MAARKNSAVSWGQFANTKVGDVERPKPIPLGHYIGNITGAGDLHEAGKNNNLIVEFPVTLTEPMEDVDTEDFANSAGFYEKGYKTGWWITPDALYRFTEFGAALGASDELEVPALAEFIATSGEPLVFEVSHREGNSGGTFVDLNNPIPLSKFREQQGG